MVAAIAVVLRCENNGKLLLANKIKLIVRQVYKIELIQLHPTLLNIMDVRKSDYLQIVYFDC